MPKNDAREAFYATYFDANGNAACAWCGVEVNRYRDSTDPARGERCHLVSQANGGGDGWDNVLPGCRACNLAMGNENAPEPRYVAARPFTVTYREAAAIRRERSRVMADAVADRRRLLGLA